MQRMSTALPLHTDHARAFQTNRFVYPVLSRRSHGISVGVNLNPDKICNFDCIYCQVDRRSECAILERAAAQGLSPEVLWCAPDSRVLVTRYVPPGVWTREEARSAAGIAAMGRWFARLHRLELPRDCRGVDYVSVLQGYVATLTARGAPAPGVTPFLEVLRAVPALAPRPAVLCHNDVHHLNIVGTIDAPRVIDWEYAGAGDGCLDLAQYALAHGLDSDGCARLLAAYGAAGRAVPATELRAAMDLAAAVNAAWAAVARAGESGPR